jgi:hypothetical protein
MHKQRTFLDTAGILMAINPSTCDEMFPSAVKLDHERKYDAGADGGDASIALAELHFVRQLSVILDGGQIGSLKSKSTFAGVDEYFKFEGAPDSGTPTVTHRLRFGSNCPCRWTTKVTRPGQDTTHRETMSVKIPYEDLADCRRSLKRTSLVVHHCSHMRIAQSGQNWFLIDTTGYIVEIALYTAVRLLENDIPSPAKLLIEVAPWDCSAEVAIQILERYEELFQLQGKRITAPNTELFGDL